MRKLLFVSVLVLALIVMLAPSALAYDRVIGCVTDAYGNPWTHGGTVTCVNPGTGITTGSGTISPTTGCFEVFIGNGPSLICTIDPGPGPLGDPAPYTCFVPTDSTYPPFPWDCGTGNTGTGPNSVSLRSVGADVNTALPWAVAAVVVGALALAVLATRRKATVA